MLGFHLTIINIILVIYQGAVIGHIGHIKVSVARYAYVFKAENSSFMHVVPARILFQLL